MADGIALWMVLVPGLPLLAAVLVAVAGPRWLRAASHWPVVVALGVSAAGSLVLLQHVRSEPAGSERVVTLWSWAGDAAPDTAAPHPPSAADSAAGYRIDVSLRADALTCIMLTMVTLVSLLIAIYSIGYMRGDRGYWRFFAYLGLFVFAMTSLVSVSNFLLLFVFWEAVGVCSYLLIGFWYERPAAVAAGKKAFLVNRIGDFGFLLGVLLIWTTYGTLNYHDARPADTSGAWSGGSVSGAPVPGVLGATRVAANDYVRGGTGLAICLLLLLGACGKSAQFPLHVWLPDAMEGPTPVSALIHAATMVTAGVYMVARCTPLFMASPEGQLVVACVGGFTALMAALIALTQFDLKRVLAYSTVSQLGYMFLALGTSTLAGISAGMFHLIIHAFFKALLFLGAGSVMHAMGNVIDMRQFGGLRHRLPVTYRTFLIGCLALAGIVPLSGFWSKDAIMASVHGKVQTLRHAAESAGADALAGVEAGRAAGDVAAHGAAAAGVAATHWSAERLVGAARIYEGLYYAALVTVFLTAFYTFRALYLTFFGDERIPFEAGSHACESPRVMLWPLGLLAVPAAAAGLLLDSSWWNGAHPFAALLARTPTLAGAVAVTESAGSFHFQVAAVSTLVALGGVLLATYLYLGARREVQVLQSWMDLVPLTRLGDGAVWADWGRKPALQAIVRVAARLHLRWLVDLVALVLTLGLLVLAAPLQLLRIVSPYRLSYGKFFFDELYRAVVVWPLYGLALLCAWLDNGVVDGVVNQVARIPVMIGGLLRTMQTGLVQFYALAMVLGAVVLWVALDRQLSGPVSHLIGYLMMVFGPGPGM